MSEVPLYPMLGYASSDREQLERVKDFYLKARAKICPICAIFTRQRVRRDQANVKRFQGWPVIEALRLLYHSTLGLRVIKKKREDKKPAPPRLPTALPAAPLLPCGYLGSKGT